MDKEGEDIRGDIEIPFMDEEASSNFQEASFTNPKEGAPKKKKYEQNSLNALGSMNDEILFFNSPQNTREEENEVHEMGLNDSFSMNGSQPIQLPQDQTPQQKKPKQVNLADAVKNSEVMPANVQVLQTQLQQLKQAKAVVDEKYQNQKNFIQLLQKEHNDEILHKDTEKTMAKYQLVFIKLETSVSKILTSQKMRQYIRIQKAFNQFKYNASLTKLSHTYKSNFILLKFTKCVSKLRDIFSHSTEKRVASAFGKWERKTALNKRNGEFKKRIEEVEEAFKKEKEKIDKSIKEKELKNKSLLKQIEKLKENEAKYKGLLKEKEEKEKVLKDYVENLKKKSEIDQLEKNKIPKNIEDRLQLLETQVGTLESENVELKERLESTENNVGGFIHEMSELLDSQEFTKFDDLEFNDSNELDEEELLGCGGTGGSSKVKTKVRKDNKGSESARNKGFNTKYKI